MDIVRLVLALFLPWGMGCAWVHAILVMNGTDGRYPDRGSARGFIPLILGYGFLLGMLLTTLVLRVWAWFGFSLAFWGICIALVLVAFPAMQFAEKRSLRETGGGSVARSPAWQRVLFWMLVLFLTVRYAGFFLEIIWRPLYAWDAWWHYATKARVWFELKALVPMIGDGQWLNHPEQAGYAISVDKFATIPLVQTWMALAWGQWNDSLIDLPWLVLAVALGLAMYGQLRLAGLGSLYALVPVYLLLTMPYVDVHVALPGYADLWVAAAFAMAAMAFFHWSWQRDSWQLLLALLFAGMCALAKVPGVIWALAFVPAGIVVLWPRLGLALIGSILILLLGIVLFVPSGIDVQIPGLGRLLLRLGEPSQIPLLGEYSFAYRPVWSAFGANWFLLDNWHLFWYGAVLAFLCSVPALRQPHLRAPTVLVAVGLGFIWVVFFLTQRSEWAENYTQLNRAVLHMVPMLLFYLVWLVRFRWRDDSP